MQSVIIGQRYQLQSLFKASLENSLLSNPSSYIDISTEAGDLSIQDICKTDRSTLLEDKYVLNSPRMSLDLRFCKAAHILYETVGIKKDHPMYYELDALYYQVMIGDAQVNRPSNFTILWPSTKLWDAWNKLRGTSKEEAMKRFLTLSQIVLNSVTLLI